MKKTEAQRVNIARDYHCGDIDRARQLLGLLLDDFFSSALEYLTPEEQHLLEMNLLSNYDTIAAVLNTVCDILFTLETDLDAAAGVKTKAAEIRKEALCAIYGLTEDKEAAPDAVAPKTARGR